MKKLILLVIVSLSSNCFAQGWKNCEDGVNGYPQFDIWCDVRAMAADTINNVLYASGNFEKINDTVPVAAIAKWDGTTWSSIPALDSASYAFYDNTLGGDNINCMAFYHGALFLPASITANSYTTYYVIRYDGKKVQWLPYLDGEVNCFTIYDDTLYIGGDFYTTLDTVTLNHIAKWDGTNWQPVGAGFTAYAAPTVLALGVCNDKLCAGGIFDGSGNTKHLFSIAQWDDTGWTALGRGISWQIDTTKEGAVNCIGAYQNNLYVGGQFGYAGDDTAYNLAEWDGNKWQSLKQPFGYDNAYAFKLYDNKLYIGGGSDSSIASWNGVSLQTLDSGVYGEVLALEVFQNKLYVGGTFDSAGSIPANRIAYWSPDTTTTSINNLATNTQQLILYPNPTSGQLLINSSHLSISEIQIENILGQTLINERFLTYMEKLTLDVSTLPQGIYFYRATDNNSQVVTGKFIKE